MISELRSAGRLTVDARRILGSVWLQSGQPAKGAALVETEPALAAQYREAALHKATLKTDAPSDLVASVQQREVQLDEQAAKLALEAANQHAEQVRRSNAEEIQRLTEKLTYARQRVDELQQRVTRMQVAAPRAGTIVYPANDRGEKHKVGDGVWRMENVMQIVGLGHMLFDVSASDPATLAAVAFALAAVATLAGYIPARRAMSVDPLVALRYE